MLFILININAQWRLMYFNENSTKNYLIESFYGTYSNSVEKNTNLTLHVFIQKYKGENIAYIKFYEYGSYLVKPYKTTFFNIKMITDNNNVYKTNLSIIEDNSEMFDFKGVLTKMIINNKNLKIQIVEITDAYPTIYNFTTNNNNLILLLPKLIE